MRAVVIGCVELTERLAEVLGGIGELSLVGIVTRSRSAVNSDFRCLEPFADRLGIPCLLDDRNDQEQLAEWLRGREPDLVFCLGWSYLLKRTVLSVPTVGVVGYHPAALPSNRGRHPIIWALVLGLEQTASTFFLMDAGADSGDILHQVPVSIEASDTARTLYDRLASTAAAQLAELAPLLAGGEAERRPQDPARASYWRKRSPRDGEIDWRMNSRSIYNLVRALSDPYPGAHCVMRGSEIKVWGLEIGDEEWTGIENVEPGKVLDVTDSVVTVKTGSGAVRLTRHEFRALPEAGSYLP